VAEVEARRAEKEAMVEANRRAKQREEELKQKEKESKEQEERKLQEKIWEAENATTTSEKQATCLHSHHLAKEQQKKKFRCGDCGQKRGMIGYRCPHCSILACQVCLSKLTSMWNTS